MTPFEFGKATALFTLGIMRERTGLAGAECTDGHLFFTYCDCEDCHENTEAGYFPGIICTLCGAYFDEYEDEDDDEL